MTICYFSYFPFGFEVWIRVLIASVPDLGIFFTFKLTGELFYACILTCILPVQVYSRTMIKDLSEVEQSNLLMLQQTKFCDKQCIKVGFFYESYVL